MSLTISIHFDLEALFQTTRLTLITSTYVYDTVVVLFANVFHIASKIQ